MSCCRDIEIHPLHWQFSSGNCVIHGPCLKVPHFIFAQYVTGCHMKFRVFVLLLLLFTMWQFIERFYFGFKFRFDLFKFLHWIRCSHLISEYLCVWRFSNCDKFRFALTAETRLRYVLLQCVIAVYCTPNAQLLPSNTLKPLRIVSMFFIM